MSNGDLGCSAVVLLRSGSIDSRQIKKNWTMLSSQKVSHNFLPTYFISSRDFLVIFWEVECLYRDSGKIR